MYDSRTYTKSIDAKKSLFKVHRMLQNFHRKFDLFWDSAQGLSIYEQTIGFQGRHKENISITFKYAGDGLQYEDVCDCGYTYYFIYCNDDIPYSTHYTITASYAGLCMWKRNRCMVWLGHMDKVCRRKLFSRKLRTRK